MKRLEVRFAKSAIDDLKSIYEFVFDRSRSANLADGFVDRIEARCMKVGNAPHGGTARDDLAPGLRTVPFERTALIAYRIEDDRVVITNVFYRGRDVDAAFAEDA
ncbi:MAG: type II toxin-antitoxin system RelE/ParE family toxin [Roseitalea sp.]|jgi:toxin ParE1/3/4|nr:type II toxin-antitoxin system RelE/ParE family toxin [Roseitalea sp.]MBO6723835.1 type II toxin-antitoxin system RelE/ParE family toxin [Roseitalea sp.]MBO6745371.1 type II toxin-antitoxin system RelE/ParE family toxin [Roseitalea sp.]